jgi:hypothetical protein
VRTKKRFIDFPGVGASVTYVAGLEQHSGAVFGYPTDGCGPLLGAEEWTRCIRLVVNACVRYVCIELGACWGPWLVAAARQRGIQLAGVEASDEHFQFMVQHFRNNGLEPDAHFLFRGVIEAPGLTWRGCRARA